MLVFKGILFVIVETAKEDNEIIKELLAIVLENFFMFPFCVNMLSIAIGQSHNAVKDWIMLYRARKPR